MEEEKEKVAYVDSQQSAEGVNKLLEQGWEVQTVHEGSTAFIIVLTKDG